MRVWLDYGYKKVKDCAAIQSKKNLPPHQKREQASGNLHGFL
jgi:hypothetical protein